jgi:putative ABC transport system permease protein
MTSPFPVKSIRNRSVNSYSTVINVRLSRNLPGTLLAQASLTKTVMIKNYLVLFGRNMLRYKTFSLVNVFGLTLGIACFSIIILFAEFEFSFDKFHHRSDNIYRIVKDFANNEGLKMPDATTPPALGAKLRTDVPEVESITRFLPNRGRRNLFQYVDKQFYELELMRVDSAFFSVFDFELVKGSKERPFNGVHSMVLTESIARKYFGDEDPIGKIIRTNIGSQTDFEVTGVLKDVPLNSHFSFQVLIPFQNFSNADTDWSRHIFYTYVRLKPGSDPVVFESKVKDIVRRQDPDNLDMYYIQPINDIHLTSRLKGELGQNGDLQYVQILLLIGIFVIVIAGINYVNLITAQSLKRAKEIGIRKVNGAFRGSLIFQFLLESVAVAIVSSLLAIIVVSLISPYLASTLGVDLSGMLFDSNSVRFILPASVFGIGILAGVYPAFYLSSFRPLRVFSGKLTSSGPGIRLRQGLVIFQFVISSGLIISFLVIRQQVEFIHNRDLGFEQQRIVTVPNVVGVANAEVIAEDLRKIANVESVACASGGIFGLGNSVNGIADKNGDNHIALNFLRADYDFIPTLGMKMIQGRNFDSAFPSDSSAIIINETAVRQLGLKEPVIGQMLRWDDESGTIREVHIVGVARDFHFTSFHDQIKPFGFILEADNGSTFFVRINVDAGVTGLAEVEKVWKKHNPDKPFDYVFQDEYTGKLHAAEERFQKLFTSFTILAIVVACLGLFGLVTALSDLKTKEIGIRKVLGASVTGIIGLLSKQFMSLVVIAFIIAAPLSVLIMRGWLDGFAYHVELQCHVLLTAGAMIFIIAMATVCFQALKAAIANPVDSLRNE